MELTFKLTVEQTNVIMEALGNAPYRVAAPIVALLQQQAAPQMQPQLVSEPKESGDAG
jgi:hypothetical protein